VVTVDEIRAVASELPRSSEGLVRGQVKFRIGRIVWLALSRDGSTMGFAFPKELRNALVESDPEKFSLPSKSADLLGSENFSGSDSTRALRSSFGKANPMVDPSRE